MQRNVWPVEGTRVLVEDIPGGDAKRQYEEYESPEAYFRAEERAERAELWERIKHPIRAIREYLLGGEPDAT
jgi:hypothetical protein